MCVCVALERGRVSVGALKTVLSRPYNRGYGNQLKLCCLCYFQLGQ